MRAPLFWRAFAAFVVLALVAIILCTVVFVSVLSVQKRQSYENEVFSQAREVAQYMAHLNTLTFVRENSTMQYIIRQKLNLIKDTYAADIWLVSYSSGTIQILDRNWNTSEQEVTDEIVNQLEIIAEGKEIRRQGLFASLGNDIVTIGVPWRYSDGQVVGAVLLHIPSNAFEVDVMSIVKPFIIPVLASLLMGVLLSGVLARGQSKNINKITSSVRAFGAGDMTSRVALKCGGELQELGNTINEMADAISELEDSRRAFVANVSHELRSPLTSMRGYIDGMMDGTIPEDQRGKYLSVVRDETQRLTNLVNDLLNLSRIESGKFPVNKAPYDICEQLRRVLITFEGRIDAKNADVEVDMPDERVMVNADQNMINQVITNLVDNAVKFLPAENAVLGLKLTREGSLVRVSVEDNGIGIPAADLPHIFERFYRADKARNMNHSYGLGLAIAQSVAEEHHGKIWANSEGGYNHFCVEFN